MRFLLHGLLHEQANITPDAIAIEFADETVSYRALDDFSSQLARAIKQNNIESGQRVAILSDKNIVAYAGIYGVLKSGCAYVSLDPRAPADRLRYIIDDCTVSAIIVCKSKIGLLQEILGSTNLRPLVIVGDHDPDTVVRGSSATIGRSIVCSLSVELPASSTVETDLAYILYTSGSTGQPKGVMITHLNSLTFVRWARDEVGLTDMDRVSGHAPLHFDLSIFDIFATASVGATLLPVTPQLSIFPAALAEWIAEKMVSVWYSVPSVLSSIAQKGGLERKTFPCLRTVVFAGEVLPVKYLRIWMNELPNVVYFNWYGPTETNVVTSYRVRADLDNEELTLPIGLACKNTDVFCIDELGDVIDEVGVEGELCARGSCVAQGYWGDAKKTNSSFRAYEGRIPIRDTVYRTGDIVTKDAQGMYRYIGRRDHMVKIRGNRVELGEIEHVLYDHDAVLEAVVTVVTDEDFVNHLKAYVVFKLGSEENPESLLTYLADKLPRYMLPESIEQTENLPRTSTGKVDRTLLPELTSLNTAPRGAAQAAEQNTG